MPSLHECRPSRTTALGTTPDPAVGVGTGWQQGGNNSPRNTPRSVPCFHAATHPFPAKRQFRRARTRWRDGTHNPLAGGSSPPAPMAIRHRLADCAPVLSAAGGLPTSCLPSGGGDAISKPMALSGGLSKVLLPPIVSPRGRSPSGPHVPSPTAALSSSSAKTPERWVRPRAEDLRCPRSHRPIGLQSHGPLAPALGRMAAHRRRSA